MHYRSDDRKPKQLRDIHLEPDVMPHAEGSCLVQFGDTQVFCSASVDHYTPRWKPDDGTGWVTAEYGMLPRATNTRSRRNNHESGRSKEIQRLIGRSLRAVVDFEAMGQRTITIDCDVFQADGGTRTAAITGGYVALAFALRKIGRNHAFSKPPLVDYLAAVSVGYVGKEVLLDLCYEEDSAADVDMNVAGTGRNGLVEVQMSSESRPVSGKVFQELLDVSLIGIEELVAKQKKLLGPLARFLNVQG